MNFFVCQVKGKTYTISGRFVIFQKFTHSLEIMLQLPCWFYQVQNVQSCRSR